MGSSLGSTCVRRISICVELSQQHMHQPVRTMEELCRLPTYLDLEHHQENDLDLGQLTASGRHPISMSVRSSKQVHPPTRSSGGLRRLRFGLIEKQASGFLT
ncbi:hypothetical protein PIB30_041573 [Stylosanthes scabra]|uniref:Uncharacterized protein n=1 Tax=Stylosanthes scabra TaxID=79078 RepID=A0ABU6RF31_9FABA|nr:hypothetical protein [Stylosanthes scabra]